MPAILIVWREHIKSQPGWKEHRYEGYLPVTIDVTAFWRPALKRCPGKHYHPGVGRALPAVIFGITAMLVKSMGNDWFYLALLNEYITKDHSEKRLWKEMLKNMKKDLKADEIAVIDAGMHISDLQEAGIDRYVLRLAINFTARRNYLPAYILGHKPTYGLSRLSRRFVNPESSIVSGIRDLIFKITRPQMLLTLILGPLTVDGTT